VGRTMADHGVTSQTCAVGGTKTRVSTGSFRGETARIPDLVISTPSSDGEGLTPRISSTGCTSDGPSAAVPGA
jgi:hypothetical protein